MDQGGMMAKAFRPDELSGSLPPAQSRARSERKALITSDAESLLKEEFAPIKWAVPGIIPEGVTLFAGSPKIGKSWASLYISIAVASGGHAFGSIQCDPGEALYIALEDNKRRMQRRLKIALRGAKCPEGLHFAYAAPAIDQGLIDELSAFLDAHPDTRVVTIDTIKKIRPASGKNDKIYDTDYAVGMPFLELAAKYSVAIVLVHHTNKSKSEDDLDTISGSNGLSGGVDNILIMRRERRQKNATMYITGRDIEDEKTHELIYDQELGSWVVGDDGPTVGISPERRVIYDTISNAGPITGRALTSLLYPGIAITRDCKEWARVRKLTRALVGSGHIETNSNGELQLRSHGSHGHTHAGTRVFTEFPE
jgi:hypothetical protein